MTPKFTNLINSKSRIMDYIIKFTPPFAIPQGYNIKIMFPAYMSIMFPANFSSPSLD